MDTQLILNIVRYPGARYRFRGYGPATSTLHKPNIYFSGIVFLPRHCISQPATGHRTLPSVTLSRQSPLLTSPEYIWFAAPSSRACSSCNDKQFDQAVIWWKAPPDAPDTFQIELQQHFPADTNPLREQFSIIPVRRHVAACQWPGNGQWRP